MGERRKKRSKREMLADMLETLDEGAEMNKNQIRIASGIGGQHLNALVDKCVTDGLLEWTGEILRPTHGENYGQKLKATERGKCWLRLWLLLNRVADPKARIRVTIKNREKE